MDLILILRIIVVMCKKQESTGSRAFPQELADEAAPPKDSCCGCIAQAPDDQKRDFETIIYRLA